MNKVMLIGNLANKPMFRIVKKSNTHKCMFTLAIKSSQKNNNREYVNISVYGDKAKFYSEYLEQGFLVSIDGWIWGKKCDYKKEAGIYTKIIAENINFISTGTSTEKYFKEIERLQFKDFKIPF